MTRRALLPCPIDAAEARSMIEQIDPRGILRGYRTGDRMAVEGLAELLVAVSGLAAANPWLAELDLNPVIVTADGCCAVDWVMVADRTTANR
jgi:hypothetical protein